MKDLMGHLKSLLGRAKRPGGDAASFQMTFARFREVLGNNNKALEIITDMGEKLGGDYLFDIVYLREVYSRLQSTMLHSVEEFGVLTRNRYSGLPGVLERIDSQVRGILFGADSPSGERVYFYEDISWYMSRDVGGKNAALAELKNYLKLDVPEAFGITGRAFDEFMAYGGLAKSIEELAAGYDKAPDAVSAKIRDAVLDAPLPVDLEADIGSALERLRGRCEGDCFLAVRSSAEEEDSEYSFAGQFETVLNVPLRKEAVAAAYKKVVASLFSVHALAYQKKLGYPIGRMKMAVGCVVMVDAAASGVMYSAGPDGERDVMVVNSTWGLGEAVVEGQTDSDLFRIRKGASPEILSTKTGAKEFMIAGRPGGGTERVRTPEDLSARPSLTPTQISELAGLGIAIERHFRQPQDIEWAIDRKGRVFILQSRPLKISDESGKYTATAEAPDNAAVILKDRGIVVQRGAAAGGVFIVNRPEDLRELPKGSILVSRHDSSGFVRVMPYVSGIITDVGTPTSHMASLCREFRIPTIVNAGEATRVLRNGQKITLFAGDEGNTALYDGIVRELIEGVDDGFRKMEEVYEYRKKRYVLRYISPLNLVDPLMDDFSPEKCKTLHDILRFIHEKSVAELIDSARYGTSMLKKHAAVKLDLPVPAGIIVVDIGGGLNIRGDHENASIEEITSIPLRAIVKGMTLPGVWHSHAVSLKAGDFLSSMMRMSDITTDTSDYVGYNVAVVSEEYVNLSLRFGYHFNMLDCYCSENTRNNHIYFRFVGGATDIIKRSRRVQLLSDILKEFGFNISTKGDLIIARLANISREEIENLLDQLGRLIAYTRQLDALLHDDSAVARYAQNFLEGNYEIS